MEISRHKLLGLLKYGFLTVAVIIGGVLLFGEPSAAQEVAASQSSNAGLIIARVLQVALGIAMVVLLGFLVYGGFLISSAEGEEIQEMRGKKIVKNSAILFVAVAIVFGILTFAISRIKRADRGPTLPSQQPISGTFGGFPASLLEAHYPEDGQRNLSRNTSIMMTFTQEMDLGTLINNNGTPGDSSDDTLNSNNIKILRSESDPAAGPFVAAKAQVTEDGLSFLFTPIDLLGNSEQNTLYTVIIGEGVASADGLSSFAELGIYAWEFEVGTFIDLEPPHIVSVVPQDDTTHPRNVIVQVTFNEAMNPLTVTGSIARGFDNISIKDSAGEIVEGRFTISNQYRTVEFITDDFCGTNACGEDVFCLPGNESFNVELRAATVSIQPPAALFPFDGITDAAANSFDGDLDGVAIGSPDDDYRFSFNTTDKVDLTPPVITSVTPGPFDTNVSLQSPIEATFSKPLQFSSISHKSVNISNLGAFQLSARTDGNQSTVTIDHQGLEEDTTYSPQITSDLRDLYQNCYRPCIGP